MKRFVSCLTVLGPSAVFLLGLAGTALATLGSVMVGDTTIGDARPKSTRA